MPKKKNMENVKGLEILHNVVLIGGLKLANAMDLTMLCFEPRFV